MDKIIKLSILPLILAAVCVISRPADAYVIIYVFDTSQSTVTQTGGFAGVHETYNVTGQYRLNVDSDTGIALFETVDANLVDETGAVYGQSLDEIFNMTGLAGIVVNKMTLEFKGKTADGTESDVLLKLNFSDDMARLTGNTTPPPNSADMFIYDVNAVAIKKYAGGAGEPNDPYQIATAKDLITLGDTPEDYDKHFIATADIDLDPNLPGRKVFDRAVIAPDTNDATWEFEGTPFTGVFDGNGHTISNLTIIGTNYLGLFGQLGSVNADYLGLFGQLGSVNAGTCEVNNLGLVHVVITGSGQDVGGLVGSNYGNICSSYSIGTINGLGYVGGLVGYNWNGGSITKSYSNCSVSGGNYVGGLVGTNGIPVLGVRSSTITQCYSSGKVNGTSSVGGLVGMQLGVSVVDISFWDTEASGQTVSDGGTGKTTAEMQMASTFLEAGWDFAGETKNGTEDIWSICEKTNYPRFVWQIPLGDFVCPDGVTIEDFAFLMEHWLDNNCDPSNGYCDGTDLDQSGSVNATDLEIFFENWPDKN